MKRYLASSAILLAALTVVCTGCSKVEELNSNPDSALQIESVGGVSQYALMQAQPASKAVIDGNELPGSEAAQGIGIFVTADDGSAYDGHDKGYSNVKYTYNGEKWNTTTPVYLSNTVGKLYGYFPYNAGATNLKAVPVASSLNGTDYLYAEQQEVSISKKSVNLQMNHALARLHLTLKKGEKYKAEGNVSKITLKSTAIDATGTMDITTGEVTATKAKTDKGAVELAASGSLSTGDQTYDILLVPADGSDAATPFDILISIDGATAGVTLSGENGITVQSGKQYDVTLEIQDSGIKVSGVGVGVWGDGGSQQVQVDGHTVTVKVADDVTPHDILTDICVDGDNVIIRASSFQGRDLACNVGDNAKCERSFTNDKFTFIISEICSNIEAVLGYAPLVLPAGALPGVFTVADDGQGNVRKVHFSQGNLTYSVTDTKWSFFEHQHYRAGNGSASTTLISLFTWGYGNWSTDPYHKIYLEGHTSDGETFNPSEDWGSQIGDGKTWRTLTSAEWQYLFNTRKMENGGARFENLTSSGITVEGVTFYGMVLFPDDFTEQTTWKKTYTTWKALDDAGIVFLPATGFRNGNGVTQVDSYAYYWSSNAGDNIYRARRLFFSDLSVKPVGVDGRYLGISVRLITECQ